MPPSLPLPLHTHILLKDQQGKLQEAAGPHCPAPMQFLGERAAHAYGRWTYVEVSREVDAGSLLLAVQVERLADKVLDQLDPVTDVLQGGRQRDRGM